MRIVSLGLCTVVALSCGDGDTIEIDPNYLESGARPGASSDATSRPGSTAEGDEAGGAKPSTDDRESTSTPEPAECADEPAASEACSTQPPTDQAASTDGELPSDDGGSAGGGSGSAAGGGAEGSSSAGGNAGDTSGAGGSGAAASGGSGGSDGAAASGGSGGGGAASGGSGGEGGTGNTEAELLPDLILDATYLMATIQQDTVDASTDQCLFNEGCVTGDGPRRVVRFGTRSANVGTADVVVGEPVAGNPLWEYDACHEHFHFEGYARYDLVDAGSGEVLPIGNKNGFCLRDLDSWNKPSCATYDCDYQGISVGCADVYTPDLDCQWVDITDVVPGTYQLVVTVNTERSIREQSFDNNSATVTIEILPSSIRVIP
jgi:hypothetical protein